MTLTTNEKVIALAKNLQYRRNYMKTRYTEQKTLLITMKIDAKKQGISLDKYLANLLAGK